MERQPAPYGNCQEMSVADTKRNAYSELYVVNYTARVTVQIKMILKFWYVNFIRSPWPCVRTSDDDPLLCPLHQHGISISCHQTQRSGTFDRWGRSHPDLRLICLPVLTVTDMTGIELITVFRGNWHFAPYSRPNGCWAMLRRARNCRFILFYSALTEFDEFKK